MSPLDASPMPHVPRQTSRRFKHVKALATAACRTGLLSLWAVSVARPITTNEVSLHCAPETVWSSFAPEPVVSVAPVWLLAQWQRRLGLLHGSAAVGAVAGVAAAASAPPQLLLSELPRVLPWTAPLLTFFNGTSIRHTQPPNTVGSRSPQRCSLRCRIFDRLQ